MAGRLVMASKRPRQLNVRLEDEYWDLLDRLGPVVSADVGVEMVQADLIRMGLKCLAKRYLPDVVPTAPRKGKVKP
jgi:hypothetical protein